MRSALVMVVASLAVAVSGVRAQVPRTLDLATAKQADTVMVPQGFYVIRISNQLPGTHYLISTSWHVLEVPAIAVPGVMAAQASLCPAFSSAVDSLRNAGAEEELPRLLRSAQALADSSAQQRCSDVYTQFTRLVAQTTKDSVATYELERGQFVRVEVTRPKQEHLAERHWQLIISTGPSGEWQATYGFGVPVYLGGQVRYSVRQSGSTFQIGRDSPGHFVEPVPAVFFSWMTPSGTAAPGGRLSWTAGLGADLSNPSVFLGGAWTWKRNFQIAAGFSLRQEPVLLGKYSDGDTVPSNLTFDQITEKVYRVRPFIALTLRFSKDPFGSFGWLTGGGEAKPKTPTPSTGNPGAPSK